MILDILLINLSLVLIYDYFNFPNEIASQILGWLSNRKINNVELRKPFGCYACMTFWCTLIYFIIIDKITIAAFALCVLNAFFAKWTAYIVKVVNKLFTKLMIKLEDL